MNAWSPLSITMSPVSHSLVDPAERSRRVRRVDRVPRESARIRQIVACLDGSDLGRGVVPHAQRIARALGSDLTLLHVLEPGGGDGLAGAPQDPLDWGLRRREARAHLEEVAADAAYVDAEIQSELVQGRAAEQICRWGERHSVDLTVFCSHGTRGRTEFGLASTARKLIERSPGSLLMIPAEVASRTKQAAYRKILVPLDGSTRSESVLPIVQRIAAAEGAEIVLVHVVADPEILSLGAPDAEGSDLERRVIDHNERVARGYLQRIRARLRQDGADVSVKIVREGNVYTRLEELIRGEEPDLVVMSAHGSTARPGAPVGSVTEYVLAHTPAPLMVLRERSRSGGAALQRAGSLARGEVMPSASS